MTGTSSFEYVGSELELFAAARRWKAYVARTLRPYIRGDVLEVGAGLGATTEALIHPGARRWVCLEPDAAMCAAMAERFAAAGPDLARCEPRVGTLEALGPEERFDTLLYIDVLEHIQDDRGEVARATDRLRPGGHLVVLVPAHQWLFSPFDAAIGHFRRYSRTALTGLRDPRLQQVTARYLDAVGMAASLANKLLLRKSAPSPAQIKVWDTWMVPCSRVVDPVTFGALGKSLVVVWKLRG